VFWSGSGWIDVINVFTTNFQDSNNGTFEGIVLDEATFKNHKDDRIYVWNHGEGAYRMYWMQDASADHDDEILAQVNQYLTDPASAAPAGTTTTDTAGNLSGISTSTGATAGANPASSSTFQVDALSSILQNLGMPPADTTSANSNTTQQPLTLADLQGAMAQVQTRSSTQGPSLDNLVTPASITNLLQDPSVCARLLQLLPPDQQTQEHLEANLRSPQVASTLRALTSAVSPDADTGATDGLTSLLANFQLPAPSDPMVAQQNPI
jgi:hypothetical protein